MIGALIRGLADFYVLLILVYCVMTWFPNLTGTAREVFNTIAMLVEPYLNLFRKIIPPAGGMDFSPIIAVIVLQLVVRLIF